MDYIKTDDLQWVKSISEDEYEVIEVSKHNIHNDTCFFVQQVNVNIKEYPVKELEELIYGYYPSLEYVKNHCGDMWKQIVAEIIAENESLDINDAATFYEEQELAEHLLKTFGIQMSCSGE